MNSEIEKWLSISFSSGSYLHEGFRFARVCRIEYRYRKGRFRLYRAEYSASIISSSENLSRSLHEKSRVFDINSSCRTENSLSSIVLIS